MITIDYKESEKYQQLKNNNQLGQQNRRDRIRKDKSNIVIKLANVMILGKIAMLMMARKKLDKTGGDPKQKYWREFQAETIKDLNKASFLVYERYPIALWCIGYGFSIFGIILMGLIVMHKHIFLDDIEGVSYSMRLWISSATIVLGFFLLLCAKKEKLRINRNEDWIYVEYKNVFLGTHLEGRYLHCLKDFNVVKKGIQTFNENTLHYVIRFTFSQDFDDLEVAESRKFIDIKKKYIQICAYLDKDIPRADAIKFIDESKVTLKWKLPKNQKTRPPSDVPLPPLVSSLVKRDQIQSAKDPSFKPSLFNRLKLLRKFKYNDD